MNPLAVLIDPAADQVTVREALGRLAAIDPVTLPDGALLCAWRGCVVATDNARPYETPADRLRVRYGLEAQRRGLLGPIVDHPAAALPLPPTRRRGSRRAQQAA